MVGSFGALLPPRFYGLTSRRWLVSIWPSFGSFAASGGVSPLQSFSGTQLKSHGCISGVIKSLCIAYPACVKKIHGESSRTTLLTLRTPLLSEQHSDCRWAGGNVKQKGRLVMASPFSSVGKPGLNSPMEGQLCKVWDGLQLSP